MPTKQDDLTGRRPHRKTTSQEDDLTGSCPKRKTVSQGDNLTSQKKLNFYLNEGVYFLQNANIITIS